jgi:RNA polymerase sigma-70 factor (ECF subfamily)
MPRSFPATIGMPDPASSTPRDPETTYEAILAHALRYARRILPADEAFEIAHDVALQIFERAEPEPPTGQMLYLAIIRRRRDAWRATERRAVREGTYLERRTESPRWPDPEASIEARELRARIRQVVASMPPGMREVFLLVREQELTYKEAAARLGIGVATVHTQLSRAGALLRECVRAYHADDPSPRHKDRKANQR